MLFDLPQTSSPSDLATFKAILDNGLANVDSFNKVYVAALSGGVAFVALVVGALVQLAIMKRQLKAQREIAENQQRISMKQLDIQLSANRRLAHDNIATKRQEWINGLRSDLSLYLAMWQDISFRWQAIVDRASEEIERVRHGIPVEHPVEAGLPRFETEVADLRFRAHEIVLRIRLRLNPKEEHHNDLVELVERLERNVDKFKRTQSNEPTVIIQERIHTIMELIVKQAQIILKEEWDRVKGEQVEGLTTASQAASPK